ncbi:MAG TPA: tryptophan synthase subunit alpha [Bacteroidales bacterium]|nr:tryptophan synthase subunit alpha [Bacteroidales bacterium]
MNRIDRLFQERKNNILSIYFTAGHPEVNSTPEILVQLEKSGVNMVEIGMPFSDPLADGPVIQDSSTKALKNGMNMKLLFDQLKNIRAKVNIPLLLMGYLNPVLHFGVENFCAMCREAGIDGVILPDLPLDEYEQHYKAIFEKYDLRFIFLITPQTSDERIRMIDSISKGFIYMVSSSSTTGVKSAIAEKQLEYFKRIRSMQLKNPLVIGFGISNKDTFNNACQYANGAIIGSAFVKMLNDSQDYAQDIHHFIQRILA